jgi:hypothetical protein
VAQAVASTTIAAHKTDPSACLPDAGLERQLRLPKSILS